MPPTGGVPSACPWGRTPNAPHGLRVQKQGRALRRGLLGAGWKAGGAARQRGGTSPETGRWPHQGTGEEAGREDMSPRREAVGPSSPPGCLQQVRGRAGRRTSPRPGPADRASPLPGPKLCRGEVGPLLSLPTPAPTPAPGDTGRPSLLGTRLLGNSAGDLSAESAAAGRVQPEAGTRGGPEGWRSSLPSAAHGEQLPPSPPREGRSVPLAVRSSRLRSPPRCPQRAFKSNTWGRTPQGTCVLLCRGSRTQTQRSRLCGGGRESKALNVTKFTLLQLDRLRYGRE